MKGPLQPAADMRLYYVDDAGVLFCASRQELHLLNRTATLIWSLLEEGCDEHGIAEALRNSYRVDGASSERYTAAALSEWREKGFIANGEGDVQASVATSETKAGASGPPWRETVACETRCYRMLSSRFAVAFSDGAQVRVVHPVLQHLHAPRAAGAMSTRIEIATAEGRLLVYRDREFFAGCRGIDALAPVVKAAVWTTVVRDHRFFLDIHAGVVSDGVRCLLLPAAPGSGKSTLTAALVHAGYGFFSDEVALLDDGTLDVFPVPLAICIKESGIDAIADRFPQVRELPIHHRGDGKRVAYLPPPAQSLPTSDSPRPVGALVFPRFAPDAPLSLAPIARAEALQRLTAQCMGVSERLDFDRVEALVRWIASIPCFSMAYGSTDEALAAIARIFPRTALDRT